MVEIKRIDGSIVDATLPGEDMRSAVERLVRDGVSLANVDFRDYRLCGAQIENADMRGAKLHGANLTAALLWKVDLTDATLPEDSSASFELTGSTLGGSTLEGVPVVPNLDREMLRVTSEPGALDMANWHCVTTHCRAGWAIQLAGRAGILLEERVGPALAGALIYAASTGRPVPNFYASNNAAMADIRRCADMARQLAETQIVAVPMRSDGDPDSLT